MERSVLFVTALNWEATTIVPAIDGQVVSRRGPCILWKGRSGIAPQWLLRVGVGSERAARGLQWAAEVVRPTVVASTGCGGALRSGIGVGDVVVADTVVDASGRDRGTSAEWRERYHRASVAAGLASHGGRILTSEVMLLDPESKGRAAEARGALAVEMEAAVLADLCVARGVEFCAARVILDAANVPLAPELPALTNPDGTVSTPALVRALARRPGLLRELLTLRTAMHTCRQALGRLHLELIRGLR
jgi:adenosylhomocysteine nucleosidase